MKKLIAVASLLALFSLTAMAAEHDSYPKAEVFGGYQFSHLDGGLNANGWDFSANGNFNDHLGIAGDFGASYKTQNGVSFHNYTYTFGPVLSLRANKGYTPFVHALIGGDHATTSVAGASGSGNGFALLAGGGVDFNINHALAFRGAADWMMLHSSGSTSGKNLRIVSGLVFRF